MFPNSDPGKVVKANTKIGDEDDWFYCYDNKLIRENSFSD